MKISTLFLLFAGGLATGCNQPTASQSGETDSVTTTATTTVPATTTCFIKAIGQDTVLLQLVVSDSLVNGHLSYNFFEKDKNTGEIKGSIKNNIIRATYQFMSEGVESTRNVVFRLSGNQVFEGVPDNFSKEGAPIFNSDDAALKFDTVPMETRACE
ncbi:hypothetical protein [Chitinophaga defluvii]|uniref:Lipoprotein n=1 Tax=Chitinophaga defluvii TaxID=3163343 RepID=A0ABV2T0D8_9BACT